MKTKRKHGSGASKGHAQGAHGHASAGRHARLPTKPRPWQDKEEVLRAFPDPLGMLLRAPLAIRKPAEEPPLPAVDSVKLPDAEVSLSPAIARPREEKRVPSRPRARFGAAIKRGAIGIASLAAVAACMYGFVRIGESVTRPTEDTEASPVEG
jgi:hypothetical protein